MTSPTFTPTTAVVTGANRGIGFEVCRQLGELGALVFCGARDPAKGEAAAAALRADGLDVVPLALDVTDAGSVAAAAVEVADRLGSLDVLVNNAGGTFDYEHPVVGADLDHVQAVVDANCFGAWRVTSAFVKLLRAGGGGRVVNLTSEAGSFSAASGLGAQGDHLAGYAVAKAAVNALTVKLADALRPDGILVNAISPGFVATYPGTEKMGARPVPEGAASVIWGATLPADGPTGGFFRDGEPLTW